MFFEILCGWEKMKKIKVKSKARVKKELVRKKLKGLAGIVAAVASTNNAPSYHRKSARKKTTTLLDLDDEIHVF